MVIKGTGMMAGDVRRRGGLLGEHGRAELILRLGRFDLKDADRRLPCA
jgi:hypothetical protein